MAQREREAGGGETSGKEVKDVDSKTGPENGKCKDRQNRGHKEKKAKASNSELTVKSTSSDK